MFISSDEKQYLFDKIKLAEALIKEMSLVSAELTVLKAKIKALESKPAPKKQKTSAQLKAQREYMRKYVARKRAEKLAQQATA